MTDSPNGDVAANDDEIVAATKNVVPDLYADLRAPEPLDPTPPTGARLLGFVSVLFFGLLGALIGYGVTDLSTPDSSVWPAVGALVFGVSCAVGVGIIVSLTLRAMGEWNAVHHPESAAPANKR